MTRAPGRAGRNSLTVRGLRLFLKKVHFLFAFCAKLVYLVSMIKIEKNENLQGWFNIFVGGFLVEQVQSRAKALRLANKLAKKEGDAGFSFLGNLVTRGEI